MKSVFNITNDAGQLVIDIEGVIGIPEWMQFDKPEEKVSTYQAFKDKLEGIRNSGALAIVVNIRSTGGSVEDALLIYDTLTMCGVPVSTNCYGYTASAATIVAQAATDGGRNISRNALYLIHNSQTEAAGNKEELSRSVGLLKATDERIAAIYAARGGKDVEEYRALMAENDGKGKWLSADEAVSYCLADGIIDGTKLHNLSDEEVQMHALPDVPEQNQKTDSMKIKILNSLQWILGVLGMKPVDDQTQAQEVDAAELLKIDAKLAEDEATIKALTEERDALVADIAAKEGSISALDAQLGEVTARASELEAENKRLNALPTEVKDIEDPTLGEPTQRANLTAYEKDALKFK